MTRPLLVIPDAQKILEKALPDGSEEALALQFSSEHADTLRFVAKWGKWLIWDSKCWRVDETLAVFNRVRATCRAAASTEQRSPAAAIRLASGGTVAAVERLARADRRHAATHEQWDADPWLLNTQAGVVDLRTGTVRAAQRTDYMTKITATEPGSDRHLWNAFISRITGRDEALADFIQRMCGYALTGSTREHALFFLWGTGANGKSVFINTISGLLGDYAKTAPVEAFIASNGEHHPTDLAGLQGSRLVTAVETEDGRCWAESKLKALTGGDRIAARFMRQDFFEFVPQFKLVIAGNHKPGLRSVDESIRRRFHLIPFTVTIPENERDPELAEKLRNEWPGILGWMIEGCLAFQHDGLKPPDAVRDATGEYLASEDTLARWMEDCCIQLPNCSQTSAALFASWRTWCEQNQEYAGSHKRFSQNLEERGFNREHGRSGNRFVGIGLRVEGGPERE